MSALRVDATADRPLYLQLYDALRKDILEGNLRPGRRLAASRVLARDLGVSRNTVIEAYDRLYAEGYLKRRVGAGTFVSDELPERLLRPERSDDGAVTQGVRPALSSRSRALTALPLPWSGPLEVQPFRTGIPAGSAFPFDCWLRIAARAGREIFPAGSIYADPMGSKRLRRAVAEYLYGVRGLPCDADQVLIVGGSQQGLHLAGQVLADPADRAWIEEPGYLGVRPALAATGILPVPVAVDEDGLRIADGKRAAPDARLVVVTPSHQFPTGAVLCLRRRLELLEWAAEAGAWIVEDDYDSEYRYQGRPLATLKHLDTGHRVLYLGTFSKVLFPALRLGYLVLPPDLVEPFRRARAATDLHGPSLEQETTARFIEEGHFVRHLRKMRVLYGERQRVLIEALRARLGGLLEVQDSPAGSHVVGYLPEGTDDLALSRAAWRADLIVPALNSFCAGGRCRAGLLFGYAAFDREQIVEGVERLAGVIDGFGAGGELRCPS